MLQNKLPYLEVFNFRVGNTFEILRCRNEVMNEMCIRDSYSTCEIKKND